MYIDHTSKGGAPVVYIKIRKQLVLVMELGEWMQLNI